MKRTYTVTLHWKYFGAKSYTFSDRHAAFQAAWYAHNHSTYIMAINLKSAPLTSL